MYFLSFLRTSLFRLFLFLLATVAIIFLINTNGLQPSQAQSDESSPAPDRILTYNSEILVNRDASLRVAEMITVKGTAPEIKSGINREFSLDIPFQSKPASFRVIDVLYNGKSVNFSMKTEGDKKHINIDHQVMKSPSDTDSYTIQYQTDHWIDFSDEDTDQLYWNVTGQGWSIPIDQVRAKVLLPDSIPEDQLSVKALVGKKDQSYEWKLDAGKNPTFVTTRPLQANEGFKIIVAFPKGYLEPTQSQSDQSLERRNSNFLEVLIYLAFLFLIVILMPLLFWYGRPSNFFD
ncbi:Protein of unknown function DUF2207, membrane [Halothece sp. PCC 7418]|uniref:DUF2207 domain-containing protein n=1 Tax=Halothece sp. (strain PCC 7418) TaxID=65093 RepID=UPI0002A0683B|nr:DUF2207 domain-containing protein [Halothece sp. PCC 7418]AFZ44012.1 Protein of unknown function DUF2207, membrane [Halothece sp. PCC 7418]